MFSIFRSKTRRVKDNPSTADQADSSVLPLPDEDLYARIQELVAQNNINEALQLLQGKDIQTAPLLRAQYNSALQLFQKGKISFAEWSQTQARINYAILSLFQRNDDLVVVAEPEKEKRPVATFPMAKEKKDSVSQLALDMDKLDEALTICEGFGPAFLMLKSRHLRLIKEWHLGLIGHEVYTAKLEKIQESLLFFLKEHPET